MTAAGSDADPVDDEGLQELLREALDRYEAPDPESTEFAKLAIEFRGLAVGETIETPEFATSRDAGASGIDSAGYGNTQLYWEFSPDGMIGAVVPANRIGITLERPGETVGTVTSEADGTFEFNKVVKGAHRLVVGEKEPWSTPWFYATS